jgi:ABC-type glycerol-3-phosphate transport system permease component
VSDQRVSPAAQGQAPSVARPAGVGLLGRQSARRALSHALTHLALLVISLTALIPLVYMVTTALKPYGQELIFPIRWIPQPAVWQNFPDAWTTVPTATFLENTAIITFGALIGELLTSSLVAYGFARLRFPGRNILFMLCISSMMLPFVVLLIPLFIIFRTLHWIDTFLPLIVPGWFGVPFFIFMLRQYFLSLPHELDDAAKIDGAGILRVWWSILLPLIKPAIAAAGIFSFIAHWNDFLGPLIFLNTEDKFTVALGVNMFFAEYQVHMDLVMAYSVMVALPVILVFFVFQRYFVQGIALTGLTGR